MHFTSTNIANPQLRVVDADTSSRTETIGRAAWEGCGSTTAV